MKLYGYWRSSTSYRVRAALNLKKLDYEYVPVNIAKGEQFGSSYSAINPGAGVPSLVLADGTTLVQSLVILDYLEAMWPDPGLVPIDPVERANVMAVAHIVALDIHPLNNLRVMGQLQNRFGANQQDCTDWMHHWMSFGFQAAEKMIAPDTGFAFGKAPCIADLCIVTQMYNARRWKLDVGRFPRLTRVEKLCLEIPEIAAAHPDRQPDAQEVT